jgi:hypothetical protein
MRLDLTSAFLARHARLCVEKLGAGVGQDGTVWRTAQHTAVKFFDHSDRYAWERDVYQVLTRKQILWIAGHNVPELILFDDELKAIEMTIVVRPFILDFAGAKLPHEVPDFDADVVAEHHRHLQELFDDRWADALHVAEMFRQATGYTLLNIHPGNVAFAAE